MLAAAIALMAGGVWITGRVQAHADGNATHAIDAGQKMLIAMLDQETGLRGYINTREQSFLGPYRTGRAQLDLAITDAQTHATDRNDGPLIAAQLRAARQWQRLAEPEVTSVAAGRAPRVAAAARRKAVMDRFRAANAAFIAEKQDDRDREQAHAHAAALGVIVGVGVVFGLLGWLAVERPARDDARRRRRLADFGDALQVARTEGEGFDVLRRHLEGWLARARVVVLVRNASANRLEAATGLDQTPVLAERLEGAAPESCLSVRLAKPYSRMPNDRGLLTCDVCGALPETSTCMPTIVGGEVIGSVLVQTAAPLGEHQAEDLESSVVAAAPVIANLRNLALAEMRAATDALTGLANHRAVQDTLNRMVAQAGRAKAQLTAILFDLDHFKKVNDIHGHAKGDEVLASVGAAVAASVRESDFVGRYGGEEFVALLPDSGIEGGARVAEKLRKVIEALQIPGLDQRLSASFGVATLPGNAVTGEQLLRSADRALYAAKGNGRNRVEVVRSGEGGREPAEAR
ncbi:MAG: diguanylate cyclase [Thermoleophilaceae bacterium]